LLGWSATQEYHTSDGGLDTRFTQAVVQYQDACESDKTEPVNYKPKRFYWQGDMLFQVHIIGLRKIETTSGLYTLNSLGRKQESYLDFRERLRFFVDLPFGLPAALGLKLSISLRSTNV